MKSAKKHFAACLNNEGYPASLEIRKLYQAVPDETAAKLRQVRVIDESGEDYLYPENYIRKTISGKLFRRRSVAPSGRASLAPGEVVASCKIVELRSTGQARAPVPT